MSLEYLTKKLKKEDGVTLVELLAAIAILTIIVTAFLAFFTQAGRTNNMTDDMNQATFIAVEEMERITNLSQQGKTFGEMKGTYVVENSDVTPLLNNDTQFDIIRSNSGYTITLQVTKKADPADKPTNLYRARVTVTEGSKNHAEMQSVLPFGADEE